MTTISVPMPKDLLEFVDRIILSGEAENRAQAIRKAIRKMREQTEINDILEASRQIKEGVSYSGSLKDILKHRKNA
ncbi:MAG: ribbon-helix-helix domain-containing protein [bacterium]|nr:ribbon-helix-helix domain-containing protein [bacterium]